jgi:hypothetical protein
MTKLEDEVGPLLPSALAKVEVDGKGYLGRRRAILIASCGLRNGGFVYIFILIVMDRFSQIYNVLNVRLA